MWDIHEIKRVKFVNMLKLDLKGEKGAFLKF